MQCPACLFENRDLARFCLQCGTKLGATCPHCHRPLLQQARYCDQCGFELLTEAEPPVIDYAQPRSYTPRFLIEKIIKQKGAVEGERKLITVLFADVVNYTAISEKLDPEEVHRLMDRCFKLLMDEIHKYEGTITQFSGDGIMALFGAPIAHEDHARRACHAALSIQEAMKPFSGKVKTEWNVDFSMRVGLNSGLVIVASIGDDLHMDYTAIGDTINLASRMESMAAAGSILVSEYTERAARDFFTFRARGKLAVKGRNQPVEAFELVGAGAVDTRIAAAVAHGLAKFVGREREVGGLSRALEKVESGVGQVIGLVGEAGVGKSRLVLEFRRMLEDRSCLYLEGHCLHFGSTIAYLPILEMLKSYFSITEQMREATIRKHIQERIEGFSGHLAHLRSPIHELLSVTVEDDTYLRLEPRQRRERTFEALRDLFIRVSQEAPVILVVEDLHWVDNTSEDFLTYLIGWLANTRILLILLYRPQYTHPWANRSYYMRLGLDELAMTARQQLLESLLAGAPVTGDLRDFIISRAGGNPLFIEELTSALQEKGYIRKTEDGYTLAKKNSEIQVPDTVQGIIAARIDRLDEELKRTMQIASVLGRGFPFSILDFIVTNKGYLKGHLKEYLQELQNLEFVYEESLFPELKYLFKHALVQEVAYNTLLLKRRKEIHSDIGQAIEALYPDRLEEFYEMLAYHYARSERSDVAYTYLKLSGIKAARNSALWESFRFYREAIEVLAGWPESEELRKEQVDIRLLMVSPMISLGFPEDSLDILNQGEKLCRELGEAKCLTTLLSMIGLYHSVKGNPLLGVKYNEDCFRIAETEQDVNLIAPVAFDLCSNYASRGEFLKIIDVAPRVLSFLERAGKESECFDRGYNVYTALSAFYAFATGYMGSLDRAKVIFEKGISAAQEIENLYSLGLTETLYGYVFCDYGDGKEGLSHFTRAIHYLEKGQIFILLGLAWAGVGWSHYFMGEPKAGLPFIEKGLKIHSDAGISYDLSVHYYFLGVIHFDLGNLELAHTYIQQALKLAQRYNEVYYVALALPMLGRILGSRDTTQLREAEDHVLQGIHLLDDLKVKPQVGIAHLCLADVYAHANEAQKALQSLKIAEVIFEEIGAEYWLAKTRGFLKMLGAGEQV
ncbi:MAG TPA: adenylate/guanylate cyclase domain-containing protein [Syntrophorhabdales bacterium]|nr:adenylate/guanylate cyclase domain-containing protein [Syntrophorhabdales bacterium]